MRRFDATGLWPLISSWHDPNHGAEAYEHRSYGADADEIFRALWDERLQGDPIVPFGLEFPGLAHGRERCSGSVSDVASALSYRTEYFLLLVPVQRPFEVYEQLGWQVPGVVPVGTADWSIVMASWESRFGAVPFNLEYDTLHVVLERPPLAEDDLSKFVAEEFSLAADGFEFDDSL